MVRARRLLCPLGFVALALIQAAAQPTPAPPKFVGRLIGVYDDRTGNPVDSAEVRDMVTGSKALTTSTGTLTLFFVDTGGSLIRIRKLGYKPLSMFVQNSPEDAALTLTLEPIAQELPKVVTLDAAPKYIGKFMRDFEERRKSGLGTFVPDSILRREENRTLGNVISAHVPSVSVIGSGSTQVAMSRRSSGTCPVDVYLDGIFVSMTSTATGRSAIPGVSSGTGRARRGSPTNDLNQFQVNELGAVEFHNTADTPIEYSRPGGGCGVLLLWTREK